jgi:hypothetical protein
LNIELYDLSNDESESNNLADTQPSVVSKIKAIMEEEHLVSKVFPMPVID